MYCNPLASAPRVDKEHIASVSAYLYILISELRMRPLSQQSLHVQHLAVHLHDAEYCQHACTCNGPAQIAGGIASNSLVFLAQVVKQT